MAFETCDHAATCDFEAEWFATTLTFVVRSKNTTATKARFQHVCWAPPSGDDPHTLTLTFQHDDGVSGSHAVESAAYGRPQNATEVAVVVRYKNGDGDPREARITMDQFNGIEKPSGC
jgi:hypothetical protein